MTTPVNEEVTRQQRRPKTCHSQRSSLQAEEEEGTSGGRWAGEKAEGNAVEEPLASPWAAFDRGYFTKLPGAMHMRTSQAVSDLPLMDF